MLRCNVYHVTISDIHTEVANKDMDMPDKPLNDILSTVTIMNVMGGRTPSADNGVVTPDSVLIHDITPTPRLLPNQKGY